MKALALPFFSLLFLLACSTATKQLPTKAKKSVSEFNPQKTEKYWENSSERQPASSKSYKTLGSCDGLPRVDLKVPEGFCVGLVRASQKGLYKNIDLKKIRGLVAYKDKIFMADMGGWGVKTLSGSIYRIDKISTGNYTFTKLNKQPLFQPHSLKVGPDKFIYAGLADKVIRFNPELANPVFETVIDDLPHYPLTGSPFLMAASNSSDKKPYSRHPLSEIEFDGDSNLYVNVGSASDNCDWGRKLSKQFNLSEECPEAEGQDNSPYVRGVIRKYFKNSNYKEWINYSYGLRNSMALLYIPESDQILQAENARDDITSADRKLDGQTLPHEEFNLLTKGKHYGWPYCYDNNSTSPEYKGYNCSDKEKPHLLLPAHASPLGIARIPQNFLPESYAGNIITTFHGHQESGQRLVMFQTDSKGLPYGSPRELISQWQKSAKNPRGRPVGVAVASDHSIFISDDENHTVLRLFYDGKKRSEEVVAAPTMNWPPKKVSLDSSKICRELSSKNHLLAKMQKRMDKACLNCHSSGQFSLKKCDYQANFKMIIENGFAKEILGRLQGNSKYGTQMPPGGLDAYDLELVDEFEKWISTDTPLTNE